MLTRKEVEGMGDVELLETFWEIGRKAGIEYYSADFQGVQQSVLDAVPLRGEILRRMYKQNQGVSNV